MRTLSLVFLLVFSAIQLYSQETGNDTYTIQRLIIKNDKGEILLQKHKNGWMTPALRHNTATKIDEGLSDLAQQFGLQISKPQLRGIFMYFHNDDKKPSFRQHYSCQVTNGKLKVPAGMLDAQWFSSTKAVEAMLEPSAKIVSAVGEMTEQLLLYPDIIWGGSYMLIKQEGKKTQAKLIEPFYPMGSVSNKSNR